MALHRYALGTREALGCIPTGAYLAVLQLLLWAAARRRAQLYRRALKAT